MIQCQVRKTLCELVTCCFLFPKTEKKKTGALVVTAMEVSIFDGMGATASIRHHSNSGMLPRRVSSMDIWIY